MPKILKRFFQHQADVYVFPAAAELEVGEDDEAAPTEAETGEGASSPPVEDGGEGTPAEDAERPAGPAAFDLIELEEETGEPGKTAAEPPKEEEEKKAAPKKGPIDYAKVQANAMLADARREAEEYKERARQEVEEELDLLRRSAREDGYNRGYTEGLAEAAQEAKEQRERAAAEQIQAVQRFLEEAVRERDAILDNAQEELKDLALAVAEKVIRVSLRGSADILRRMVEQATDKRKRCEWAHIYIADCDVRGSVNTIPELTAALSHISDRVRVIPMADDESGTCIIEMPDEIMDASVMTQLGNIKEVLSNSSMDDFG